MGKMTATELINFAKSKLKTPYVYGCKGEVLTKEKFYYLQKLYGKAAVWDSDINKVGKVCVDCSGLISWATGVMYGSYQLYSNAKVVKPIRYIKNAPIGALVWQLGHVGIYIGDGKYIAADGSAYGVRINNLSNASFTHYLLMDYIEYGEVENMTKNELRAFIEGIVDEKLKGTNEVSDWAKDEWNEATSKGITDGKYPTGIATREQVVAMILRANK